MNDRVMVVTPTFCTEENKRLPMLLQSIYWVSKQTHKNLVHVVVDDGSTDETPELLEEIAFYNPHIHVYHKENGGSSAAVNFGVAQEMSKDRYSFITITHSDDLLPANSIEDRVNSSLNMDSKFVYSDQVQFYTGQNKISLSIAKEFPSPGKMFEALKKHDYITYPTMFWSLDLFAEKIGGYDKRITSYEDWDIALRTAKELARSGERQSSLNKVTVVYRIHENNISYQYLKDGTTQRCYKMILKKHLEGNSYRLAVAREMLLLARHMVPKRMKPALKKIMDIALMHPVSVLPYRSEFVESLNTINYRNALIPT